MRLETALLPPGLTFTWWNPQGSNLAGPAGHFVVRHAAGIFATSARSESIH